MATPQNPYAAPSSRVDDAVIATPVMLLPNGRAVPAGLGWHWIAIGWDLFKRSPGTWVLIALIVLAMLLVSSVVPFFGTVAMYIAIPVLAGGIMLGCAALERGEPLEVAHLFAGLREHTAPLVIVGLLYLAGWAAIVVVIGLTFGVPFMMAMLGGSPPMWGAQTLLLTILIAMALSLPLVMAIWFAPALVTLHAMKPVDALKASFIGCLKNIVPFLVYGVIALVLGVLATLPLLLGLLVYLPVMLASVYAGYRDIFTQAAP